MLMPLQSPFCFMRDSGRGSCHRASASHGEAILGCRMDHLIMYEPYYALLLLVLRRVCAK